MEKFIQKYNNNYFSITNAAYIASLATVLPTKIPFSTSYFDFCFIDEDSDCAVLVFHAYDDDHAISVYAHQLDHIHCTDSYSTDYWYFTLCHCGIIFTQL
jgi:hypothetical protein